MADQSQLSFLLQGVKAWNEWWKEWFERNPRSSPPTVDLSGASLPRADLSGALLGMADLTRANLSGTSLNYANFYEAFLRGANLSEANLERADLSKANLAGANLSNAEDLRGADFSSANLLGANLSGAQPDLTQEQIWENAIADARTCSDAAEGRERARSATELFVSRAYEVIEAETKGYFTNQRFPDSKNQNVTQNPRSQN